MFSRLGYGASQRRAEIIIGKPRLIKNIFPPPEVLAFKEEGVKVTLTLNKSSVEYFKKSAKKHHASYQKMIRRLIDAYAAHFPLD